MNNFADRLKEKIKEKGNSCVVTLDFYQELLPKNLLSKLENETSPSGYRQVISTYYEQVIETLAPYIPAVKPNIALLENMTWVGSQIFSDIVKSAKDRGLIVIAETSRGGNVISAEGYAKAFLRKENGIDFASGYDVDAMTINAYSGRGAIEPYLKACKKDNKGVFVDVKASNNGASETQNSLLTDNSQSVYTAYAKVVAEVGIDLVGESGYSSVGAIVSADYPKQAMEIRSLIPKAIIMVPCDDKQQCVTCDIPTYLDEDGFGALVTVPQRILSSCEKAEVSSLQYNLSIKDSLRKLIDDIIRDIKRASKGDVS